MEQLLGGGVAVDSGQGWIHIQIVPFWRGLEDTFHGFFEDIAILLLGFAQGLFGLNQSCDILGNAEGANDIALLIEVGHFTGQHPSHLAGAEGLLFHFVDDGLASLDDALLVIVSRLGMVWIKEIKISHPHGL